MNIWGVLIAGLMILALSYIAGYKDGASKQKKDIAWKNYLIESLRLENHRLGELLRERGKK